MGLVVSIVPAGAEVHLRRGIDAMWRRRFTQRAGKHVVCFVVLVVVALRDARVVGTEVASGPVLFHVQPPIDARLAADRSPQVIIRVMKDWRDGCCCWPRIWERNAAKLPRCVTRGAMARTGG